MTREKLINYLDTFQQNYINEQGMSYKTKPKINTHIYTIYKT